MFEQLTPEPQPPFLERWFAPDPSQPGFVRARWLWLRALGLIFFSAFLSLWFQIDGLIGPNGISPARLYFDALREAFGAKAYWYAPTLLWFGAGHGALRALVVAGFLASIAIVINVYPRVAIAVAMIAFLSFIGAAQQFAQYQSDGMLLEAAFLSLFLGRADRPPPRAAVWLLRYEWFRIYFESGLVKILSGEPQWRDFTAMDKYYENGPLPTWLAWHVQQWPHSFHAATAAATLVAELLICWLMFFGRPARVFAFAITTLLQIGIILTANYAFLNYLVLALGILLLDDQTLRMSATRSPQTARPSYVAAFLLPTHFLLSTFTFFSHRWETPLRIANSYGLFAVMTRGRYEIEFQGTSDGQTWMSYPFRFKQLDVRKAPGIYAPYQPRFEWNLWFASLGSWMGDRWVVDTETRLLENEPSVTSLFAANPFAKQPPIAVRTILWRYWFTSAQERRKTGAWWNREPAGDYAPMVQR